MRPIIIDQHQRSYLLLAALSFLVYSGCLTHDFLSNWDDTLYVTSNPAILHFSLDSMLTVSTTNYGGNFAPLQMISYMLDHAIWGLEASGFKATNIMLQSLCGIVFYRILVTVGSFSIIPALIASALFIVHPVQVESVAWISQRKTLLATLFFLLSFLFYDRSTEKGSRYYFILSLTSFAASLLSKSSGIGLPLLLLAYDHCSKIPLRTSMRRLVPFIIMTTAIAILTVSSQSDPESSGGIVAYHGGSFVSNARLGLSLPASYLRLLVWPTGLSAHYPEIIPAALSVPVAMGLLISVSWVTVCVILLKRRNRLSLPVLLIGLGFLPVMQIIPILPTMNDRYWHLPLVGVAGLCAVILEKAPSKSAIASCLLIIALSVLSFNRTAAWSTSITLWQSAMETHPDDPRILLLMGDSWRAYGNNTLAGNFFEKSIQIEQSCEALQKAAAIRIAERSFDRARMHLNHMIAECDSHRKRDGLLLLAESWHAEGKLPEAAAGYEAYLKEAPNSFTGHNALGNIYTSLERYDDAQLHLLKAVAISPDSAVLLSTFALSRLAEVRKKSGRTADAKILATTIRNLAGQ